MDPTSVLVLLILLGIATAFAGAMVGQTKGRSVEGFFLCLFFNGFGLVAVAAMPPSRAVQRERDRALAQSLAEMLAVGPAAIGEESRICPFCAEMVLMEAVVCRYCGRDLPVDAGPDAREELPVAPQPEIKAPSVTVALTGCDTAVGPTCRLTLSVEPGFVVVDCCRADCPEPAHELVLTAEQAEEACQRLRIAATGEDENAQTTGSQNTDLVIDWSDNEEDGGRTVSFDWTAKFLQAEALARWDAGERPDEADCGTLYLSGGLTTAGSELDRFETALTECAHLAQEWDAGRANVGYVEAALTPFGKVLES